MFRPAIHITLWITCLIVAGLALKGCNRAAPTLDELVQRAAELPGVRSSGHSKLREEFKLVEESLTLPSQLDSDPVLTHKNAAIALKQALPDLEEVTEINRKAGGLLTALPGAEEELIRMQSGALGAKWLQQTQATTKAARMGECDFGLRFERGYFNDLDFVYRAAAGARLLLVDALYQLNRDLSVASERFDLAWQWTDWLAASNHLEARVQAALVRREALHVAELIANRPDTTRENFLRLEQTLSNSLATWPSLEATLVRERALAIVTYETVRLGLAEMLFTSEERRELRENGVYSDLRQPSNEQVDADQAAYLTYMREIIGVAKQPYFERAKHLVECDRLLRSGEQQEKYHWFANHLFVLNNSMTMAQAELARDRGRVEGWLHLLSSVTGSKPPVGKVNPLNGEPYATETRGTQKFVALGDKRSVNPRLTLPGE